MLVDLARSALVAAYKAFLSVVVALEVVEVVEVAAAERAATGAAKPPS